MEEEVAEMIGSTVEEIEINASGKGGEFGCVGHDFVVGSFTWRFYGVAEVDKVSFWHGV